MPNITGQRLRLPKRAIWQAQIVRAADAAARQRSLAAGALDADAICHPRQSIVLSRSMFQEAPPHYP
jgi:hypothetical protein